MRTLLFLSVFTASVVLASCGRATITIISPDGTETRDIHVEIANTEKEREKGLMHRSSLPEGSGMLFVFDNPQIVSFWMRSTLIPLDLLFFGEDGGFSSAHDGMAPCEKADCPTYKSIELTKYALELNKGQREALGIGVGWKLDLSSLPRSAR